MIDYGSMEKFEAKIGFVDKELYMFPVFNKFHKELYRIAEFVNVADVYTTKTSAAYVNGEYVHIDTPLFKYSVTPFIPENESQIVTSIEEACDALVTHQLTNEYLFPPNYVFVINFIEMPINNDGEITDIRVRYAFHKVDDQPWPQP